MAARLFRFGTLLRWLSFGLRNFVDVDKQSLVLVYRELPAMKKAREVLSAIC